MRSNYAVMRSSPLLSKGYADNPKPHSTIRRQFNKNAYPLYESFGLMADSRLLAGVNWAVIL